MVELVEQKPLKLLGALALRDVARHLGGADDPSASVAHRADRQRDVDAPSVLGQPHGVEVLDHLAESQPREDLVLLGAEFLRHQQGDGLAEHLVGAVAVHPGGTLVPAGDRPVQGLADDRVVRRRDDRRQSLAVGLAARPLGDIDEKHDSAGDHARRVAERSRIGNVGRAATPGPDPQHLFRLPAAVAKAGRHRPFAGGDGPSVGPMPEAAEVGIPKTGSAAPTSARRHRSRRSARPPHRPRRPRQACSPEAAPPSSACRLRHPVPGSSSLAHR